MKQSIYTKAEVNQAIWTVLTAKFKKDQLDAFNVVKKAGYVTYKDDGVFKVKSNETGRVVRIMTRGKGRYERLFVLTGNWEATMHEVKSLNNVKIDFVNCLDKPANDTWHLLVNDRHWLNQKGISIQKYEELAWAKRQVKWRRDEVDRIKEQLEELQKQLVEREAAVVRADEHVTKLAKKMGLRKEVA